MSNAKKFAYGIKSIKASLIAAETGLAVQLTDVGEVYRDTAEITVEDPATTEHFSEFTEDPIVSTARKGLMTANFNLMDTSAANCKKWMDGALVSVAENPDVWEAPEVQPEIYMAVEFEFENGSKLTIHRGKVMAKLVPNPTKPGFTVIEVMVRPTKPLVSGVPVLSKRDPAAA